MKYVDKLHILLFYSIALLEKSETHLCYAYMNLKPHHFKHAI